MALTSEHPKGTPLAIMLPQLNVIQKYDVAYQLLSALDYLHKSSIYIGYLSTQNVIVNIIGTSCVCFIIILSIIGD